MPDGATPAEREHRRHHRRGSPPKIDGDPEVRAFIAERIGELTFERLAAEARAAFGPRRAPSRSAIHRWWHARWRRDRPQAAEKPQDARGGPDGHGRPPIL